MRLLRMTSPAAHNARAPESPAGIEGSGSSALPAPLDLPFLDVPFVDQERLWCANCGGPQTFIVVDRFIGGRRGYCLGCEETKYVMDTRTNSEVA